MGLNVHALRLLLHARKHGANLDRVVTIGRLDILVTPEQVEREFAAFGEHLERGEIDRLIQAKDRYCEPIIERLGAKVVDSLDASDFEGASIVHDLNQPIGQELKSKYSLLLDGGTLEHVFNFPEAIKTCMSMVEVGGHALFCLPTNNEMGHGFYQFSPDLFFRVFSDDNGYRLNGIYVAPLYRDGEWLKVNDPAALGQRVGFNQSNDELGLMIFAERVREMPLFAKIPQQSDYVEKWASDEGNRLAFFDEHIAGAHKQKRRRSLKKFVPEPLLRFRRIMLAGRHATSAPDPSQFEPFDPRS
jgi:hypothetical protein